MTVLEEISGFLQKGKAKDTREAVQRAIAEGLPAADILENGLMAGMAVIGDKFKKNEIYVPEVLVAARAMNAGLEPLKPLLVSEGVKARGVVVIGTVKGDLHDIGKNLVKMMLEGKGLEVHDLGVDVPGERFVEAAKEFGAGIVCCSALLTTTMREMKGVVEAFERSDIRDRVKIMVGGAPVTEAFRMMIGADVYTPDAASAADAAARLCGVSA